MTKMVTVELIGGPMDGALYQLSEKALSIPLAIKVPLLNGGQVTYVKLDDFRYTCIGGRK